MAEGKTLVVIGNLILKARQLSSSSFPLRNDF
jgi:hypothetical protein